MIELQLLDDHCLIGVTIRLPKVRIVLIYHTKAILVSDPFVIDHPCFQAANVLYVKQATTFEELLNFEVVHCLVQSNKAQNYLGMKGIDALYALQKGEEKT